MSCPHGNGPPDRCPDPSCPCRDGLACHYVDVGDTKAMLPPAQPHGRDCPDRCSQCIEKRDGIVVQRMEIAGPITPAPGPRSIYGKRGGNARRVTRRAERPGDDEDVN